MADIYPDDFEDGDLSEYTGDTADFNVTSTGPTFGSGAEALELSTTDGGVYTINSASGLEAYPTRGDFIETRHYFDSAGASQQWIRFAWDSSTGEGYEVNLDTTAGEFEITAVGAATSAVDATVSYSAATEYRVEVNFDDGTVASDTVQATLYNHDTSTQISQVAISDTSYTTGEWEWQAEHNDTGTVYFDSVPQPAAPQNLTATATDDDIALSWDSVTYADTYRIYRAQASGSTTGDYTQIDTTTPPTTSYNDTALLDGEQYFYRVTADNDVGPESDVSNEATDTTALLAISNFAATYDSGNDVLCTWDDTQDNGNYDLDFREVGAGSWTDEASPSEATTSYEFTSLSFDTDYEFRLRGETPHVQTAFAEDTATVPPEGISSLQTTTVTDTQVDLSWVVTTDAEDHIRVERERQDETGTFVDLTTLDAALAPDATTYSDTTPAPNTTYRYTVTAEDGSDTQIGAQDTVTATTNAVAGTVTTRSPRAAWYAEVDRPGADVTRVPRIIDNPDLSPRVIPTVNGLPRVELPVPQDDRWLKFREGTLRAYYDGVEQPVDEVERISQRDDATVLGGRGGLELLDRQQLDVTTDTASDVASTLLSGVSYTADVDAYDNTVEANEAVQSADTQSEFESVLDTPGATDPWEIDSGTVRVLQQLFFFDTTADMTLNGTGAASDSSYNDGDAEQFGDNGDYVEGSFTLDYDIPPGSVGLALRYDATSAPEITVKIDGGNVSTLNSGVTASLDWYQDGTDFPDFNPGGLAAGTYTIRLEQTGAGGGGNLNLDVVTVYDTRQTFNFPNTVDGDQHLAEPKLFAPVTITFDNAEVVKSVSGARHEGVYNDTTEDQQIELSNELSGGYSASANTATFETDFGDLGPTARQRITLGGFGSRTSRSPTTGYQAQELQSYTLKADLDDTPLVVEQGLDGPTSELLTQVARLADAVWEYRIADDGTKTVTWTYPGQRADDRDPDVAEWRYEETEEGAFDTVVVKGGAVTEQDERFTSDYGVAVALQNDNLVTGSETVFDPGSDPLTTFVRGEDYELDVVAGEITVLAAGDMSDATEYGIDYRHRAVATADNGASDPRETVIDIPSVTTTRGAGQVALAILSEVDDPLKSGRLVVPVSAVDWSVTDALSPEVFPTTENLQLRDVEAVPGQVVLEFETRQALSDVISDVRAQLQRLSERG